MLASCLLRRSRLTPLLYPIAPQFFLREASSAFSEPSVSRLHFRSLHSPRFSCAEGRQKPQPKASVSLIWTESFCSGTSEMSKDGMGKVSRQPRARRRARARRRFMASTRRTNDSFSDSHDQQLLPGLPDEFTLDEIVPKLPWRAFHSLCSVSRAWRQAIQSHRVYQARVRFHSRETLFVLDHSPSKCVREIALYSIKDKSFYELPRFTLSHGGIPEECQCVSLDGKIYVLGGGKGNKVYSQVYVLDLAGQREWKQCASMREPRREFACGVKDGKLYVFGGCAPKNGKIKATGTNLYYDFDIYTIGCEVYDPKEDTWSSIAPMKYKHCGHHVATVGEEFFVHGGFTKGLSDDSESDYDGYTSSDSEDEDYSMNDVRRYMRNARYIRDGRYSEVYHPGEDKWRLVTPHGHKQWERLFTAKGKLLLWYFSLTGFGNLYVRDGDSHKDAWTKLHSFLLHDETRSDLDDYALAVEENDDSAYSIEKIHAVHAINDDLIALVDCRPWRDEDLTCLLQSRWLGREDEVIVWEEVDCSLSLGGLGPHFMCPIQL